MTVQGAWRAARIGRVLSPSASIPGPQRPLADKLMIPTPANDGQNADDRAGVERLAKQHASEKGDQRGADPAQIA
jgi:hypothetical protein